MNKFTILKFKYATVYFFIIEICSVFEGEVMKTSCLNLEQKFT